MDEKGKLYFGGVSTDIELKALREHYAEVEPGKVITHEEIEAVVGVKRDTNRYRTVMTRFKRMMLLDFNVELKARSGAGYVVLTASDRVRAGIDSGHKIHRQIRKTHYRLTVIPREQLSNEEVRRADHAQMVMSKLSDDLNVARKQIAPPSRSRGNL